MPHSKFRIRKGDTVEVLQGRDAGRRGEVERVIPSNGRIIVEGINLRKRHARPRAMGQPAGIIEFNAPLHASNVMYVCPSCDQTSRTVINVSDDGSRNRHCRKCNEKIDD
ncbi:MAG TPA: 50S ribosomal protein L24 [Chloroflexi bacterium]|nr:50S ribosomal protein L24 [Chloroflexota bacterium]